MKLSEHILNRMESLKKPYDLEDGLKVSRYNDIKRIHYYKRDEYINCEDEKAIFWQLATQRRPHFIKNILPSIKDFYPEGRGNFNQFQAWLTKITFRKWARESGFVYDLGELTGSLVDFGEGIWKVFKNDKTKDVKTVDLRRIYFDRTVDFDESDKIEVHEMTAAQLHKKKDAWHGVDDMIKRGDNISGTNKWLVYEFEGWFTDNGEPKKIHAFVSGDGCTETILFSEDVDEDDKCKRYYHFKLNDELWGLYQRLFILQEVVNRRVNQNDEAQQIASLLLLKSNNPEMIGNVLQDAINGQIVPDPTLTQVITDNRNISSFANEMNMMEILADRLCMTPDVITGDDNPSGAPFRSLVALTNKATRAFKPIRLLIAEQVGNVLINEIFPESVKDFEDKFISIADSDEDIREFDRVVGRAKLNRWIDKQSKLGVIPSKEDIEKTKEKIQEDFDNSGRRIKIEKGFFNWDYGFIYNHSNEIEDRGQMSTAMNNLMQYKLANPAIANDPLFRQISEKNGVSAVKMSQAEIDQLVKGAAKIPNIRNTEDKLLATIDEK